MPRARGTPFRIDITGKKYGRWTVLHRLAGEMWVCRCECGTEKPVTGSSLKLGTSVSCGCYSRERTIKHSMEGTPTYRTWANMLTRCRNPKDKQYHRYGGRGIKVCERWESFSSFLADMGMRPDGKSLDRIDNEGNYEPGNCRWATVKQQSRNRTNTPRILFNGKMISTAELAELHGLPRRRILARIKRGLSVEEAIVPQKLGRWPRIT